MLLKHRLPTSAAINVITNSEVNRTNKDYREDEQIKTLTLEYNGERRGKVMEASLKIQKYII